MLEDIFTKSYSGQGELQGLHEDKNLGRGDRNNLGPRAGFAFAPIVLNSARIANDADVALMFAEPFRLQAWVTYG
jgi:hypothetical protein